MRYRGKKRYQSGGMNLKVNPLGNIGTPEERAAANATAQRLANKYSLMDPDNVTIGQYLPEYVDPSGRPYRGMPTRQLPTTLPQGITVNDIQSDQGLYWYNDPQTGDPVDVDPSVVHRFKTPPTPMTSSTPTFAGRRRGGYMQTGGYIDPRMFSQWSPQQGSDYFDMMNPQQQRPEMNMVQEGLQKGIIEPPNTWEGTPTEWYNYMNSGPDDKKRKKNWMMPLGIGLMGARGILSEISGRIERGRQNNYDYLQQRQLGYQDAAPVSMYQGLPYNLYSRYGGKLVNYMPKFNNKAEMRMDAQYGGEVDPRIYRGGGNWIQGAVNPAHKGYCTPMSKPTCTGRRRQFALTMKKHHGFHE